MTVISYQPVTSLNCSKEIVYSVRADQWYATSQKIKVYCNKANILSVERFSNKFFEDDIRKFSESSQDPLLTTEEQKGLRDWFSSHTSKEPKNDFFCTYQANNQCHMNSYFSILNIVKNLSKITKYMWNSFFTKNSISSKRFDQTEVIGNISRDGIFNIDWAYISTGVNTELNNLKSLIERIENEALVSEYANKYSIPALFGNPNSSSINHFIEILIEIGGNKNIFTKEFFNRVWNTLLGSNRTNVIIPYSLIYTDAVIDNGFTILELSAKRISKNSRAPSSKNQDFIYTYLLYGSLPLLIAILGLIAYRLKKPCNIGKRAHQENLQLQENKESIDQLNEYVVLFETLPKKFKGPQYLL